MSNNANSHRKIEMPGSMRNKFVAALCMLLVSAIMLISSTYAWFTLSTAPEVKGITTQVGANGNLEMLLLDKDSAVNNSADLGKQSQIGDSMTVQDVEKANVTWGNLVDLSSSVYGLSKMMLMPAKLNADLGVNGNTIDSNNILLAPSYGSDGRVIDVDTATHTAIYSGSDTTPFTVSDDAAGVRAIGTSSGVTVRISAYNTATYEAKIAASNALAAARGSLASNAQSITNIIINSVGGGTGTYTQSDLETMQNIIDSLTTANGYIDNAIKNTALAYVLSATNTADLSDEEVTAITVGNGATWLDDLKAAAKFDGADFSFLDNAIAKHDALAGKLAGAQDELVKLVEAGNDTVSQEELNSVFKELVSSSGVTIAGEAYTGDKDAFINNVVQTFMNNGYIDVVFGKGSGVYYDISEICGEFSVSTSISANYNGLGSDNIPATVSTKLDAGTEVALNVAIASATADGKPAEGGEGTTITLSDVYGYVLDFGFRTNAANSSLLLQTEAAQRVYTDSESTVTQGLGSNLTFVSDNDNFDQDDIIALMSAVRFAFVTPGNAGYDILAMAKTNITKSVDEESGEFKYEGGKLVGTNGVSADIVLCGYTVAGDGTVTIGDALDSNAITSLAQNEAKKVSVIVYLDGEYVDNTMVANANKSVSGNLNLQFSSSATLVPMTNSALKNGTIDTNSITAYTLTDAQKTALEAANPVIAAQINDGTVTLYKHKTEDKYYYSNDGGKTYRSINLPG